MAGEKSGANSSPFVRCYLKRGAPKESPPARFLSTPNACLVHFDTISQPG